MRPISPTTLVALATEKGLDPVVYIKVDWYGDPFRAALYADRDIENIQGRIDSISDIDDVLQINNGSGSQKLTLTLSDTDGSIKAILDSNDIHQRDCSVFQTFEGVQDSILLFRGQISSPIIWDEGDRSVTFDVISQIESNEVGFSIEEGQFPLLPENLIGKAWPLVFGTALNVPGLQITSPREGLLATSFGIVDFTLAPRLVLAQNLFCLPAYQNGYTASNSNTVPADPTTGSNVGVVGYVSNFDPNATNAVIGGPSVLPTFGEDPTCAQNRCQAIQSIELQISQQTPYQLSTLTIYGGNQFQQGSTITLSIGGAYVTGMFTGEQFTVYSYLHPAIVSLIQSNDTNAVQVSDAVTAIQELQQQTATVIDACLDSSQYTTLNDQSAQSFDNFNNFPTSSFSWISAGEKVTFAFDEETIYIANLLPSQVLRVAAYRTLATNNRVLLTVPEEYYSVRVTDYVSYKATEVVFPTALSKLGNGWEDDIFITLTSPIGPNTVDIIAWLITTYTQFGIDNISFNSVKDKVDKYPMDFALLSRKEILTTLQEIAFQARCGIYLKNGIFYLKYLSEEPDVDFEITEDDILHKTLQLTTTPTEQLVTKFVSTWSSDYSLQPNKLILRRNVVKYGIKEQDYDFYAYTNIDLVRKSSLFWLIRYASTWRIATFKTNLQKLMAEVVDTVQLTLTDLTTTKGIVNKATYNAADKTIDFEIWTPILSGTLDVYPFAWPSTADETDFFPTPSEITNRQVGSGTAPGFAVIAPPGHPLSATATSQKSVVASGTAAFGGGGNLNTGQGACEQVTGAFDHGYCCGSGFRTHPNCNQQDPESTNDKLDNKPKNNKVPDNSGKINTGKEPKFNDGSVDQTKQLATQAAKDSRAAKDTANAANGAAGGAGSSKDANGLPANPYRALPKPAPYKKKDPTDTRPVCETIITISWFQISGQSNGEGQTICVPSGGTITETFKYPGAGNCGAVNPPPECESGYDNSPCCHVFKQCISPEPAACAEADPSSKTQYDARNADGSPYTGPSALQPGSGASNPGPG